MPNQKSKGLRFTERLGELRTASPDVQASLLLSTDGLVLASDMPSGSDEDRLCAMSAAILALGDRISGDLQRGTLEQVYIRGTNGYVFLTSASDETVLTVLVRKQAKLGLVFLDVQRAAKDLAQVI
jgi:hypothetical protein